MKLEENNLKVCLNDKLVKHKFFYAEEWVQSDYNSNFDFEANTNPENLKNTEKKFLRKCYLGKFVKFLKFIIISTISIVTFFSYVMVKIMLCINII